MFLSIPGGMRVKFLSLTVYNLFQDHGKNSWAAKEFESGNSEAGRDYYEGFVVLFFIIML